MSRDTIHRIRGRIESAPSMRPKNKEDVLALLNELEKELDEIAAGSDDDARSVAGFVELSTHEATKEVPSGGVFDAAVGGLRASVEQFEESHPKLVQVINSIATALSNAGV